MYAERPASVCLYFLFSMVYHVAKSYCTCTCRPRRGALVHYRDFWYPVRHIQYLKPRKKWQVRWWRECIFDLDIMGIEPGSLMLVDESDVVDSLWGNAELRQQVRVSSNPFSMLKSN